MKIIGHTAHGYLAEIAPEEIAAITGNPDDNSHECHARYGHRGTRSHSIGTDFKVCDTWKHLGDLVKNEDERKRIANSLRAAATLIDHTPSPLVPQPATQTNESPE